MSRAYCLTCNEQVMVTASGTCPEGHAVTSQDSGPEPWVGRADEGVGQAGEDHQPATASLHDVDVTELQELQVAGVATTQSNGNGQANGHAHENGHRAPSHDVPTQAEAPPPAPVERQRANSQASDDLAAMLAEALQSPTDEADAAVPEDPATGPDEAPTAQTHDTGTPPEPEGEEWDDLAALAAELQLDTSLPADAREDEPAPTDTPAPADDAPHTSTGATAGATTWSAPDEELTWPSDVADDTPEDLPSPAPAEDEPEDVDPTPASQDEEPSTGPSVDLTNFTARGSRVGASGKKTPRRLFGRKR